MRGERLRAKMRADQVIVNLSMTFYAPTVVEMLGYTDVDQIFLDAEHGPLSEAQCEEMVRVGDLVDKPIVIRVPANDEHVILRYLDIGSSGLIIPHVTTRDDAERAVRAMKFGPEGRRSFAGGRTNRFGVGEAATDYIKRANRETVVIGLFEDVEGLANVPGILAVDGLDALIVGPNDLAFSMGYPAQPWHPDVQKVVDQVIAECRRAGKPTGLPSSDLNQARQHVERGCRIITMSVASLLIGGAGQVARALHGG